MISSIDNQLSKLKMLIKLAIGITNAIEIGDRSNTSSHTFWLLVSLTIQPGFV